MALPLIISGLSAIAPIIGKMIAGDKGEEAAEHVAGIARAVTGQNDPQKAVESILQDRNHQLEFLKQMNSNAQAMEGMYLKDVQHAREQHKFSIMPAVIVVALTLMVSAMGYAIFASVIPESNQSLANILFGAVLAKWADSIAYWVGSSRGSAEKSQKLK
ncbi:MAG: hypothetical protein AAGK05_03880 [Pseudomonadota bacterium]